MGVVSKCIGAFARLIPSMGAVQHFIQSFYQLKLQDYSATAPVLHSSAMAGRLPPMVSGRWPVVSHPCQFGPGEDGAEALRLKCIVQPSQESFCSSGPVTAIPVVLPPTAPRRPGPPLWSTRISLSLSPWSEHVEMQRCNMAPEFCPSGGGKAVWAWGTGWDCAPTPPHAWA